ncbi:hypothetical protein M0804_013353 [Polistes exclamans]|nr:hypothetical protein M0804_013353 [Polistes exclamans]
METGNFPAYLVKIIKDYLSDCFLHFTGRQGPRVLADVYAAVREAEDPVPYCTRAVLFAVAMRKGIAAWKKEELGLVVVNSATRVRVRAAIACRLEEFVYKLFSLETTFHTTQLMTGHCCFSAYFHRIGRQYSPRCFHCKADADNVEHTLIDCSAWIDSRGDLFGELKVAFADEEEVVVAFAVVLPIAFVVAFAISVARSLAAAVLDKCAVKNAVALAVAVKVEFAFAVSVAFAVVVLNAKACAIAVASLVTVLVKYLLSIAVQCVIVGQVAVKNAYSCAVAVAFSVACFVAIAVTCAVASAVVKADAYALAVSYALTATTAVAYAVAVSVAFIVAVSVVVACSIAV